MLTAVLLMVAAMAQAKPPPVPGLCAAPVPAEAHGRHWLYVLGDPNEASRVASRAPSSGRCTCLPVRSPRGAQAGRAPG